MFIGVVGVDVMHARRVPTVAARFKNWTMTDFNVGVVGWSQFENFKGPDGASVTRYAILGKAK